MNVKDLPKGTKLNCVVQHTTMQGYPRVIDLLAPDNEPVRVRGFKHEYTNNHGGGYDMGSGVDNALRLVSDLGLYLYGDSKYFDYILS